ncbi:hypothetical protein SB8_02540 [Pseudomonas oryzihabitans]|nr:hypothetical protein SB8_02540 [Pseudomonas psychrotolerans]
MRFTYDARRSYRLIGLDDGLLAGQLLGGQLYIMVAGDGTQPTSYAQLEDDQLRTSEGDLIGCREADILTLQRTGIALRLEPLDP